MGYPDAHELVMTYGWNTTAYQILNPGLEYWYAPHEPAVVAYTRRKNVLLAAGAPVCAADALKAVSVAFEQFAANQGCGVCYVAPRKGCDPSWLNRVDIRLSLLARSQFGTRRDGSAWLIRAVR
jgi:lysylphosphatidylglycerol synthetase-like protein (DUF2156 family)